MENVLSPFSVPCYFSACLSFVHWVCCPCKKSHVRISLFSTFQMVTQEVVWVRPTWKCFSLMYILDFWAGSCSNSMYFPSDLNWVVGPAREVCILESKFFWDPVLLTTPKRDSWDHSLLFCQLKLFDLEVDSWSEASWPWQWSDRFSQEFELRDTEGVNGSIWAEKLCSLGTGVLWGTRKL